MDTYLSVQRVFLIASFPDHSHLQYFISCSMQIWRGKAWKIWSLVDIR